MRGLVVVLFAALFAGGCSCSGPGLGHPPVEPLRLSPAEVDLGEVFVGATRRAVVTLTNPSKTARSVTLAVPPPFSLSETSRTLAGGDEVTVELSFTPREAGHFAESLVVEDTLGAPTSLPVTGVGLAALVCDGPWCERATFDPERGVCATQRRPDGTSCTASEACFASAQCVAGACVGVLAACDDGDTCTVDACGASGCLHLPVQCPALDPCQVAYCDLDAGCTSRPVDDGVRCGASDCATAFICLGGTCQQRARPGAAQACAYDDLASSTSDVCVRALSGDIRCWGATGPRLINGPHRVAAPPSLRFIPNGPGQHLLGVDQAGQPYQYEAATGAFERVQTDGGVYGAPVVAAADEVLLLADGSLATGHSTLPFRPDAGVRGLAYGSGGYLLLEGDGGYAPLGATTDFPSFGAPVVAWEDVGHDTVCARTQTDVRCATRGAFAWSETLRGDAGLLVGSGPCLGEPGGDLACATGVPSPRFAGGLTRLTTFHATVLCGLSPAGQVHCAGANAVAGTIPSGGLGDVTLLPVGPTQVPLPGAAVAIAVAEQMSFAATDAGVWAWGRGVLGLDGGATPRLLATAGGVTSLAIATRNSGRDVQVAALDRAGRLLLWPDSTVREPVASVWPCTHSGIEDLCGQGAGGGWFWNEWWGDPRAVATGHVASAASTYLEADGGVVSGASPTDVLAGRRVPLPGPAISISEGCAVLADRRAFCWPVAASAPVPVSIPGVLPARAVVGDLSSGCVLAGTNGVQCWGTNRLGRLGNELASSASAVFVTMPGPVRQLAGSGTHTCALLDSGAVHCWGINLDGELGLEPRSAVSTPVLVTQ